MNISDSGLTRILVIRNSASSLPASFVGRAREASPVPTAEGSDGCGGRQAAFPGAKFRQRSCVWMANLGKRVDIENLLSLGDDLLGVLKNKKDVDGLMQTLEGAKLLHFSCSSDSNNTGKWTEDCWNKIQACEEKIDRSKDKTSYDSELDHLQHEVDEKLQEEHMDELIDLEHQRVSIEDRRVLIKKTEKDLIRARNLLSMCASVTNIIPDFEDQTRISGVVIDRNKKKVEKFEFERTESPLYVAKFNEHILEVNSVFSLSAGSVAKFNEHILEVNSVFSLSAGSVAKFNEHILEVNSVFSLSAGSVAKFNEHILEVNSVFSLSAGSVAKFNEHILEVNSVFSLSAGSVAKFNEHILEVNSVFSLSAGSVSIQMIVVDDQEARTS
ncbi:hypothetical protein OPV22_010934 [Ensete ventricosum]|uniref:Uncharacterized protein n=1 Tax=Ensete ventricosum TaxID=4639 RepID=A0AAV8RHY4_ENSVE|nr:hypothetical protein OPV22_010934 [Ensete ventricosum]